MESVLKSPTAHSAGDVANGQVNNFLDSVEDLTKALKDIETPEIARVRAKVRIALIAAKSAVTDTATQIRSQAQQVGKRTDNFVRENPWQVIGIAAVVGLAVGFLASRRPS
jgi:ElaB protein